MSTILDYDSPPPPPKKPIFAYIAVATSIITISLVSTIFIMIPYKINVGEMFTAPEWLPKGIKISLAVSLFFTVLSFATKEKTKVKWIAAGLNFLIILLFIGLAYFVYSVNNR
jgi:hypothetical protein